MPSFEEATAVKQVDSHTYDATFYKDWCIGTGNDLITRLSHRSILTICVVPHGGFVTACFLQVTKAHFSTTHAKQNQPHTITLHLDFLRRTQVGPARFHVKDVKLGRQLSVIHVTLTQDGTEEIVGYITVGNMDTESGVSFPTAWSLRPPRRAVNLQALKDGRDEHWAEQKEMPSTNFRQATKKVRWFFPRAGQVSRNTTDQWICQPDGAKFTNESLGYVVDAFPQLIEQYRYSGNPYAIGALGEQAMKELKAENKPMWYPTVLLNIDFKKPLPAEGAEWLFTRVEAKQIKNGRMDLEVIVMDETGDVVALSHHVVLVVDSSRNTAKRSRSKL